MGGLNYAKSRAKKDIIDKRCTATPSRTRLRAVEQKNTNWTRFSIASYNTRRPVGPRYAEARRAQSEKTRANTDAVATARQGSGITGSHFQVEQQKTDRGIEEGAQHASDNDTERVNEREREWEQQTTASFDSPTQVTGHVNCAVYKAPLNDFE